MSCLRGRLTTSKKMIRLMSTLMNMKPPAMMTPTKKMKTKVMRTAMTLEET